MAAGLGGQRLNARRTVSRGSGSQQATSMKIARRSRRRFMMPVSSLVARSGMAKACNRMFVLIHVVVPELQRHGKGLGEGRLSRSRGLVSMTRKRHVCDGAAVRSWSVGVCSDGQRDAARPWRVAGKLDCRVRYACRSGENYHQRTVALLRLLRSHRSEAPGLIRVDRIQGSCLQYAREPCETACGLDSGGAPSVQRRLFGPRLGSTIRHSPSQAIYTQYNQLGTSRVCRRQKECTHTAMPRLPAALLGGHDSQHDEHME